MKAKQWLLDNGFIESIGRGRISFDNHARLAEAVKNGQSFSDWPKGKVETSTSDTGETVTRVKRDPSVSGEKVIMELRPFTFPEDEYEVHSFNEDGKKQKRSLRDVCGTCRPTTSLVGCICGNPTIIALPPQKGYVKAYITEKRRNG